MLRLFRSELCACLGPRRDALFALRDALLTGGPLPSPASRGLEAMPRRGWGSLYAARTHAEVDADAARTRRAHPPLAAAPPGDAIDVSVWPRCDAETSPGRGCSDHPLIARDEGPGTRNNWIFWVTSGTLTFHVNGPTTGGLGVGKIPFVFATGQWYLLSMTRAGNLFTFYVNGAAVGSETLVITVPDASAPLNIGEADGQYYLDGREDEVTIFNRALTASEIQAIYNAGSAGICKVVTTARITFLNSGPIQFGKVVVGNPSCGLQSINIRNEGPVPATIDTLTIGGTHAADFTITNGTGPLTLGVQQTYAVLVRFCPQDVGTHMATLTLAGSNVQGGSVSIGLTGTGAKK